MLCIAVTTFEMFLSFHYREIAVCLCPLFSPADFKSFERAVCIICQHFLLMRTDSLFNIYGTELHLFAIQWIRFSANCFCQLVIGFISE